MITNKLSTFFKPHITNLVYIFERVFMRIEISEDSLKDGILHMFNNNDVINWSISCFDKKVFRSGYDVFKHINQYWCFLPGYKQEKIFITFSKIKNMLEEIYEPSLLIYGLSDLVKDLFDDHLLDDVNHWMNFHSDITFVYEMDDVYIASDEKPGSREKTYLKSDYVELLAMTICLRIMIPVWGEFIYRTKRETDTLFKEFFAFQLLAKSNIINSPPMEKLRVYVSNNILSDKPLYQSIINGIGSETYPDWLLAKVLINKLCIGDITGINQTSSIVTFIWNFVSHKVNNSNTGNFANMVKAKEFESGDSYNEHNASRLETYKIKTELPLGDIVILEHYMDNPVNVALQLKPNVNLELLEYFINNSRLALNDQQIWKPQVAIAQYVLKPVVSPRGIDHLSKKHVINAIAIAQTLLWESNHKVLACLMSAIATSGDDAMLSGIDSRTRIPADLMNELNKWYPFNKINSQRKKGKVANVIISAIDEIEKELSQRDWLLTIGDEFVLEVTGKDGNRRFSCPPDIKILLARLIIELVKSR